MELPGLVRVGSPDVGARVVVRHRLVDGSATDVVGELVRADDGGLAVRREDGDVVAVAAADVVAARVVPGERPRRAAEVLALEDVAARGWPALRTARRGGWLLRESGGWTRRANSALALGAPDGDGGGGDLPLAAPLAAVEAFYAAAGLPPRFSLPALASGRPVDGALDAELAARGWVREAPTAVMTAPLARLARDPALPAGSVLVTDGAPSTAWRAAHRHGGRPPGPAAIAVLTGAPTAAFPTVLDGAGRAAALARGTVVEGWLGITDVQVDPGSRRRGLARALLAGLVAWAAGVGAERAYLQVEEDNAAALALYAGAGFTVHHRSAYRTLHPR